ncbi:uncharacterized protein N7496_002591 [Penicillium cataractarum]|uniref:Uncharacterized protein n=1 Tax=Penicillium cataractarum TaxID=2100454 RepID=A0A9W9SKD6_9EURO|nr:uncharacterized protein N7496_002591 [Penicillium cataractarum]KAJ5380163.1 hypothetical protein N7496_002591 [Penicillium cataractarum]
MAHQPHKIPWDLVASLIRWSDGKPKECVSNSTSLHPGSTDNTWNQLHEFSASFARVLDEAVESARAKYPAKYHPPAENEVLLDDRIIRKIEDDLIQWRESPHAIETGVDKSIPIPREMRIKSAFFHDNPPDSHYRFNKVDGKGLFNIEIIKLLIIHDEMEPVLRACAHEYAQAMRYETGWRMLHEHALSAYLSLNTIYCLPEYWDPAAGGTPGKDYRSTRSYQSMLRGCTALGKTSEIVNYPHRNFFGIAPDQFHAMGPRVADKQRWLNKLDFDSQSGTIKKNHYGVLPFDDFITLENPKPQHIPNASDVTTVQGILLRHLPFELVLLIMERARYTDRRALTIPHDPLHPLNRQALDAYLEHCWQILVRCRMLAKETHPYRGTWDFRIKEGIRKLWVVPVR